MDVDGVTHFELAGQVDSGDTDTGKVVPYPADLFFHRHD
jgi:hypothetical protein